jgi:hypothetical protein
MSKFLLVEVGLKWRPANCSGYQIQMRRLPAPPASITTLFENMNVPDYLLLLLQMMGRFFHNRFTKSVRDKFSSYIFMRSSFGVEESCHSCFIWRRAAHFIRTLPVSLKSHPFLLRTLFQFRIQNTSWRFLSPDCTAITEEYSPCPTTTSRLESSSFTYKEFAFRLSLK